MGLKAEVSATDDRRVDRFPLQRSGRVSHSGQDKSVVAVTDLSWLGCRLALAGELTKGATVTVRFDGFEPIAGTVAWADAGDVGVEFDQPLGTDVIARLIDGD